MVSLQKDLFLLVTMAKGACLVVCFWLLDCVIGFVRLISSFFLLFLMVCWSG